MVQTRERYAGDLSELARMRALVADVCRRAWGGDDEAAGRLALAVHEAACNVIRHAYEGESGRAVELAVEADAAQARVTLYHTGRDFDPDAVAPPAFDGSREHGFGLYLIRQVVDDVTFFVDEAGRRAVRLTLKRPSPDVPARPLPLAEPRGGP